MIIPASIWIDPKGVAKIYSLRPSPIIKLEEYVPKRELDYVQKQLEKLQGEKRELLLTRREIYPRG